MGENKLFASTLALDKSKSVLPTDSGIDDPWISYPQSRSYGFEYSLTIRSTLILN